MKKTQKSGATKHGGPLPEPTRVWLQGLISALGLARAADFIELDARLVAKAAAGGTVRASTKIVFSMRHASWVASVGIPSSARAASGGDA